MLCEACRNGTKRTGEVGIETIPGAARLAEILCEECGELLPPRDSTDLFLRRLSRLAAFGLAGGAGPISKS
jgi:hypothetical protein